jgi:hypothetical protein
MAFHRGQFRSLIERVLRRINMHSEAAVNLLMGTAAQESQFGTYLRQLNGGPAVGVFQMEPDTMMDIWQNYLRNRLQLADDVFFATRMVWFDTPPDTDIMEYNLAYAIIMARLHYRRVPEPLPEADDIKGLARYWKKYYNTPKGAGTEAEFVRNYKKYVIGF